MAETITLKGIPAAPGLASGPVFKLQKNPYLFLSIESMILP